MAKNEDIDISLFPFVVRNRHTDEPMALVGDHTKALGFAEKNNGRVESLIGEWPADQATALPRTKTTYHIVLDEGQVQLLHKLMVAAACDSGMVLMLTDAEAHEAARLRDNFYSTLSA